MHAVNRQQPELSLFDKAVELLRRGVPASAIEFFVRLPHGSPSIAEKRMTRPEAALFPMVFQPRITPQALAHLPDIVSEVFPVR